MAAIAIGGQRAAVITVHVAQGASRRQMRPAQREGCGRMIECRRCPIRSRVADRAILREAGGNVIRDCAAKRCRAVPCHQMAVDTGSRIQRVIIAHMAGNTRRRRRRNVQPGERKAGSAVVPRGGRETYSVVAPTAIANRKQRACGQMRWRVGSLITAAIVRVQMAAGISAIGLSNVRQRIITVEVASGACRSRMGIGQRKSGGTVIEHARGPGRDGMARGTGRRTGGESGG